MTTRARLRSRHRKHKRRSYSRRYDRMSTLIAGEFAKVFGSKRFTPPLAVWDQWLLDLQPMDFSGFADSVAIMTKPFLDRMQPPGGPWIKLF